MLTIDDVPHVISNLPEGSVVQVLGTYIEPYSRLVKVLMSDDYPVQLNFTHVQRRDGSKASTERIDLVMFPISKDLCCINKAIATTQGKNIINLFFSYVDLHGADVFIVQA